MAVLAVIVAVTFGTICGAMASYFGGWVDNALMRIVDVILAFPRFFLMSMLVGVFEANLLALMPILGRNPLRRTDRTWDAHQNASTSSEASIHAPVSDSKPESAEKPKATPAL